MPIPCSWQSRYDTNYCSYVVHALHTACSWVGNITQWSRNQFWIGRRGGRGAHGALEESDQNKINFMYAAEWHVSATQLKVSSGIICIMHLSKSPPHTYIRTQGRVGICYWGVAKDTPLGQKLLDNPPQTPYYSSSARGRAIVAEIMWSSLYTKLSLQCRCE